MHTRRYEVARLLADRRKAQVPAQERLQEKLTQPASQRHPNRWGK